MYIYIHPFPHIMIIIEFKPFYFKIRNGLQKDHFDVLHFIMKISLVV